MALRSEDIPEAPPHPLFRDSVQVGALRVALEDVRQQLERKQVQLQDAGHHGQERESDFKETEREFI